MTDIETINHLVSGLCDHEFESYGTIETETDFYGMKDLVGYECIHCKKEFIEWIRRN